MFSCAEIHELGTGRRRNFVLPGYSGEATFRNRMPKDKPMNKTRSSSTISARRKSPDWTNGLRRLYDSVVEEPLPDSFADLLNKLDNQNG